MKKLAKIANSIFNVGGITAPAKLIGRGIKKGAQWAGGQIAKEMKLGDAKQKKYKAQGATLNAKYSGRR